MCFALLTVICSVRNGPFQLGRQAWLDIETYDHMSKRNISDLSVVIQDGNCYHIRTFSNIDSIPDPFQGFPSRIARRSVLNVLQKPLTQVEPPKNNTKRPDFPDLISETYDVYRAEAIRGNWKIAIFGRKNFDQLSDVNDLKSLAARLREISRIQTFSNKDKYVWRGYRNEEMWLDVSKADLRFMGPRGNQTFLDHALEYHNIDVDELTYRHYPPRFGLAAAKDENSALGFDLISVGGRPGPHDRTTVKFALAHIFGEVFAAMDIHVYDNVVQTDLENMHNKYQLRLSQFVHQIDKKYMVDNKFHSLHGDSGKPKVLLIFDTTFSPKDGHAGFATYVEKETWGQIRKDSYKNISVQ
jgi:hypothetical protein